MKFNIKNWQDKHLIKESKLKEMDFKDKAAFDKYQSKLKTKMRKSTKVNIAGKDTTAGDATGDGKSASKSVAPSTNGKELSDLVNNSLADFDGEGYEEEAMEQLDQLFQDTGAYGKEELTYEDGMKAIQDLDNYQDGEGIHNDEDEAYDAKLEMQDQLQTLFDEPEGGWTNDNKGNVKADGSSHDYEELSRTTKSSQTGRFDDDDEEGDDGGEQPAPEASNEFDGNYDGKKYIDPKELNADNVGDYDKSWAGEFTDNTSETYSKDTARLIMRGFAWNDQVDGKDFKVNFAKDGSVSIKTLSDKAKRLTTDSMNDPYKTVYDENPSKYSRLPKKSVTSGERKYTGDYSDREQGENFSDGFFDDVEKELGQTYSLDKKTKRKLKKDLYYNANSKFAQAAIDAKLAGKEPPTATARDFALEIEKTLNYNNQVKDGVTLTSKKESVTPRSTRIQEAKIYRTIQELKGLEKK